MLEIPFFYNFCISQSQRFENISKWLIFWKKLLKHILQPIYPAFRKSINSVNWLCITRVMLKIPSLTFASVFRLTTCFCAKKFGQRIPLMFSYWITQLCSHSVWCTVDTISEYYGPLALQRTTYTTTVQSTKLEQKTRNWAEEKQGENGGGGISWRFFKSNKYI